jgi:type VI secretion system protein ImpA
VAFSLADIDRVESGKESNDPNAKPGMTKDQIKAVFQASKDKLRQTHDLIVEIMAEIEAIEGLAAAKLSEEGQPDFDRIKEVLQRMVLEVQDRDKEPETDRKMNPVYSAEGNQGDLGKAAFLSGSSIRSRAEVDRALAAVCDYYSRCEPSSPVRFLIERARRMLELNFIESVRELSPDSLERFHPLFGTKEPSKPETES